MTRDMRWKDAIRCSLEFDALYLVKYLQDGFTLYTRMRWHDAMRCTLEFDALHLVKYLQDGFTLYSASPRNPRFPIYRLCIQTTFRDRVSIFKSMI
jgi:hypothetical protein